MLNKLTATQKGLITALAMIAVLVIAYIAKLPQSSAAQYLAYFIYTTGVVWTLVAFNKKGTHKNTFKEFFNEGFRCFIVVTLLMVVFTYAFSKVNTEFRDASALLLKQDLLKKGNATPDEIERQIKSMKDNYSVVLTSGAVFFYLAIGALVSAVTAAFITRNKD